MGPGWDRTRDQSDSHLLSDTLPTALHGPVYEVSRKVVMAWQSGLKHMSCNLMNVMSVQKPDVMTNNIDTHRTSQANMPRVKL